MSPDPTLATNWILLAEAEGTALFSHALLQAVTRLPRPGIVIFVHGVNSDGEWYEQAEQGLRAGLNTRLKRRDEDLAIPDPAAGQMQAATYATASRKNNSWPCARAATPPWTCRP